MDWLNYHHLFYFWTVAREGGVSRAADKLRLSQPTISAQLKMLEDALGEQLFDRQGRRLVLTDTGRVVHRYADEIFAIGREMMETLRGRPAGRALRLTVGVANAVPKLIVHRLLAPAMSGSEHLHLICLEDNTDRLIAQLATHELDIVISDRPAPPHSRVRVFNHLLGASPTAFFAPPALANRLRRRFPASLDDAPMLMPTSNTPLRPLLDDWLERQRVRPRIVADFEDSALMKVFGRQADAVFPAPVAIERDVTRLYGVRVVGRTTDVRESYYVISAERRLKHPGVLAITGVARGDLFAADT
jgi:LysR family transcriptional regulator, transcriptional activator of nhaA